LKDKFWGWSHSKCANDWVGLIDFAEPFRAAQKHGVIPHVQVREHLVFAGGWKLVAGGFFTDG